MPLTVSRRTGEEVLIGDDVIIRVVRIRGSQVQLEIEAPDEKLILRGELAPRDPQQRESSSHDRNTP